MQTIYYNYLVGFVQSNLTTIYLTVGIENFVFHLYQIQIGAQEELEKVKYNNHLSVSELLRQGNGKDREYALMWSGVWYKGKCFYGNATQNPK